MEAKCASSPKLETHMAQGCSVYVCRCVCVCVCMCWHTNTSEGGGSFGSVSICRDPHPALFWLLFSSLLTSIALSCSPRAEDKQRSALNSQRLLSVFLFLSPHPPPTSCCFGKNKTTTKKECCFASQGKKSTTEKINKQEIN